MKKLILVLIFGSFIYLNEAQAKEEHIIDKNLTICLEKDFSTQGQNKCIWEAEQAWDKELNKYYQLLMKNYKDKNTKKLLTESQLSWIKFRDKEFKLLLDRYSKKDGTMYTTFHYDSRMSFVQKRALELKKMYEEDFQPF